MTNSRGAICVNASPFVANNSQSANDVAGLLVRHVNGKTYTPLTVDLGEYYSLSNTDQELHFIGHKPGGETVLASFNLISYADGAGGVDEFKLSPFRRRANMVRLRCRARGGERQSEILRVIRRPCAPMNGWGAGSTSRLVEFYSKSIQ